MTYTSLSINNSQSIITLFYNTFLNSEGDAEAKSVSGLVEKYMVNYPRKDLQGFVAKNGDQIIGGVFFSELRYKASDKLVYILSPMAVHSDYQGKGIGQDLIRFAHEEMKAQGVNLTMTYGDPSFYSKVGYQQITEDKIKAPLKLSFPEGWLVNPLDGVSNLEVEGSSTCIPELDDQELW